MTDLVQIGVQPAKPAVACVPKAQPRTRVFWLQSVTLAWMLVEFGVSAYAAITARSPVMLAFGSDSLVELISAAVVLLQWVPRVSISERKATRTASLLLFALALVVAGTALASLALRLRPETSRAGIAITVAALLAMPVLAWLKRREARRSGNTALAADAAQSAACAYLALIALVGLVVNAFFHIAWFDAAAALAAIPILVKEGRSAWQGQTCGCC
jgi:divalent metal cation (Fe/Co/Zn/Cd) transporter